MASALNVTPEALPTQISSHDGPSDDAVAIRLTDGRLSWVSLPDHEFLKHFTWRPLFDGRRTYAYTKIAGRTVYLHRLVAGAYPGDIVDHRDGDGLNNTRGNLRVVSASQNQQNGRGRSSIRRSRFKGVSFCPSRKSRKWRATICINRRQQHLGYYETEVAAASGYDDSAKAIFGAYARLNLPDPAQPQGSTGHQLLTPNSSPNSQ